MMRCISGTLHYGLLFPLGKGHEKLELIIFSDADWCGDNMDRKSTIEYMFKFL